MESTRHYEPIPPYCNTRQFGQVKRFELRFASEKLVEYGLELFKLVVLAVRHVRLPRRPPDHGRDGVWKGPLIPNRREEERERNVAR